MSLVDTSRLEIPKECFPLQAPKQITDTVPPAGNQVATTSPDNNKTTQTTTNQPQPWPCPPGATPTPDDKKNAPLSNVLISKGLASSYMEKCRTDFGDNVADLTEKIYARRRMFDCYKVTAQPNAEEWEEVWNGYESSRDREGEEMVHQLIAELKRLGKKFSDPHFPADNSSLFVDPGLAFANSSVDPSFRKDQDPFLAGVSDIQWKRPAEIGNPNATPKVFSGSIHPNDVAQGRLGNCYFLAALSACAEGEDDLLLKDLIIEEGIEQGVFGVKFFVNGRWTTVVVDDQFPCTLSKGLWTPIFASPRVNAGDAKNEKELWSMVFEKAWAKLHLSYESTAGGLADDVHNYLTGGVNTSLDLGVNSDEEWKKLMELINVRNIEYLSTAVRDGMATAKNGLMAGHAYSVHAVKESNILAGLKLVQVRNPWGNTEWTGDFSHSSARWTPELKKEYQEDHQDDGSFWMPWADFVTHFEKVEVCDPRLLCNMYPDFNARVDGVSSQWIAGITAGGLPAHPTFKHNPAFELIVQGSEVILSLLQPDIRYIELAKPTQWMEMYLFLITPGNPKPKQLIHLEYKRQQSVAIKVEPGVKYRVVATAWGPGVQGAFTITACGYNCTLRTLGLEPFKPEMAAKMALQPSRETLCCMSGKPIENTYYPVPEGKLRPEFLQQYQDSKK